MGQLLKLPARLRVIAGFIEKGAAVADIGTDHGYLPVYLAQNGLARSIIASDISTGSLKSAHRSADKYGVADKITFVVAPGLSGINKADVDTVVISGLGGESIAEILKDSTWIKHSGARLILQPQSKLNKLCCFLRDNDYSIHDARLASDSGRFYVVILAGGGKSDSILEPEIELLTWLMFKKDPHITDYLNVLIAKTRRTLDGKEKSGAPDALNTAMRLAVYTDLEEEYKNANSE